MFWLAVLAAVIHVGVKTVPMFMDAERLKDEMSVKAGVAQVLKDEEILKDLVDKAKQLDLPLGPENFILVRDNDRRRMSIKTQWDVEVRYFGGAYIRNFHFEPSVDESIMTVIR